MRAEIRDAVLRLSSRLHLDAGARHLASSRAARAHVGASIRVMALHGTPRREEDAFAAQIRWARDHFHLLDPRAYLEILDGTRPAPSRSSLVFTFDDGLASNADVAAPVLESFGTRGIFFVCPAFSALTGADALSFFTTRVRPGDPSLLTSDDYLPMSPDTLRALHRRGHVIGNHTLTHQHLGTIPDASIESEIRGARDQLSTWLDAAPDCFAWTFAWNAIRAATWSAALSTHRYCFTACPGPGALAPTCIWRTNIEPSAARHTYRFFYSGLADPIWYPRRRRLATLHTTALSPRSK